jgi:hypothetical protein
MQFTPYKLNLLPSESFASVLVRFAPRECNKVAHELASIGCKSQVLAPLVMAGVPDCIIFLVSGDLADMVE